MNHDAINLKRAKMALNTTESLLTECLAYLQSPKFQGAGDNWVSATEMQNRILQIRGIVNIKFPESKSDPEPYPVTCHIAGCGIEVEIPEWSEHIAAHYVKPVVLEQIEYDWHQS